MKIVVSSRALVSPIIPEILDSLTENGNNCSILIFSQEKEAEREFRRIQSLALNVDSMVSVIYNSGEDLNDVIYDCIKGTAPDLYIDNDLKLCDNLKKNGINAWVV